MANSASDRARPLFKPAELRAYALKLKRLQENRNDANWAQYWDEKKSIEAAHLAETVQRAQARPEEYLDALLTIVGSRGTWYLTFEDAFACSHKDDVRKAQAPHDNPVARRQLYTILRALTEIPKSWAVSAFIRFLRGTGAQKGAKYHGAGAFGVRYGWTGREVNAIATPIADGRNPYSKVLMTYADVVEENKREAQTEEELIPYSASFEATRAERDVEFINRLCEMLEQRGLADVPAPAAEKPKKERKIKVFKSGDIIRKRDFRDLTYPAHVRIPIEKQVGQTNEYVKDSIEWVITEMRGWYVIAYRVKDGVAYSSDRHDNVEFKSYLDGATYLGEWTGKFDKSKKLKYNFHFRHIYKD